MAIGVAAVLMMIGGAMVLDWYSVPEAPLLSSFVIDTDGNKAKRIFSANKNRSLLKQQSVCRSFVRSFVFDIFVHFSVAHFLIN